jgi:hypothetical protein
VGTTLTARLIEKHYSANESDAALDARLIRVHLRTLQDAELIHLLKICRMGEPKLTTATERQRWLQGLIGIVSQAARSSLTAAQIYQVFLFLASDPLANPHGPLGVLRSLNSGGTGGPLAVPADRAVELLHFLKGPPGLSVKQVIKLLNRLLARFPGNPARCRAAVNGLRVVGLAPAEVYAMVKLLQGCVDQELVPLALERQVALLAGSPLRCVPVYTCLGLKARPAVHELVAACFRLAKGAATSSRLPHGSNMVCAMYDRELRQYFTGFHRPGVVNAQGRVPLAIWSLVPSTNNPDAYQFGRGCAEVDCLTQAFEARHGAGVASQSIKGCVFVAYHPKEQNERPACGGCQKWLDPSEAVFKDKA